MSLAVSRAVLRRSQFALRRRGVRNASQMTESANTAKPSQVPGDANQSTGQMEKVGEGLSRVRSSAGSMASRVGGAVGRMGGRTGRLIGFVQSSIPTVVYYSRVGLELGKLVFQGRQMNPPNVAAFQSYMSSLGNVLRHPASIFTQAAESSAAQPMNLLSRMRNVDNQQMVNAGIVAAECIGFFTVGEMLGRLKIVGYRTSKPSPEAQVHH